MVFILTLIFLSMTKYGFFTSFFVPNCLLKTTRKFQIIFITFGYKLYSRIPRPDLVSRLIGMPSQMSAGRGHLMWEGTTDVCKASANGSLNLTMKTPILRLQFELSLCFLDTMMWRTIAQHF